MKKMRRWQGWAKGVREYSRSSMTRPPIVVTFFPCLLYHIVLYILITAGYIAFSTFNFLMKTLSCFLRCKFWIE